MKRTLQIRQRLWLFMGILMLAFVAGAVVGPLRIGLIQEQTNSILDRKLPAMQAEHEIENCMLEQSVLTLEFFQRPAKATVDGILALRDEYRAAMTRFRQFEDRDLVDEVFGDVESMYAELSARQDILFKRYQETGRIEPQDGAGTWAGFEEEKSQITSRQKKISNYLRARARTATLAKLAKAGEYVRLAGNSAMVVTYAVLGLSLLIGVLVAWRLTRRITRPLARLVAAMEGVGRGGRSVDLAGLQADEFGTIGQTLEAMVATMAQAEAGLSRLNAEQGRILESVRFGLLALDGDCRTGPVHSRFAGDVFARANLAGLDFAELVYPEAHQALDRDLLKRFLGQIRSNRIVAQAMLDDINPLREFTLPAQDASGRSRQLEFHFHAIGSGQDGILVIFEDVTELVEARRESDRERHSHESDLEVLYQALRTGPAIVRSDLERCLAGCRQATERLGVRAGKDDVDEAFRLLHTLKGNAATLGFSKLAETAHGVEDALEELRQGAGLEYQAVPLRVAEGLAELAAGIGRALDLVARLAEAGRQELQSGLAGGPRPGAAAAGDKRELDLFGQRLQDMAQAVAAELDKTVVVETSLHPDLLAYEGLGDAVIHLVRNALDHGIEETYERLACGKSNPATIRIACEAGDSGLQLLVSDDGRGLDHGRIEAAARAKGFLGPDEPAPRPDELVKLIFRPGFSSKETASSLSGRGVGLDAVKAVVGRHKGKITLASRPGKGTRFMVQLPRPD